MEKDKDLISASNSEPDGEVIFRNVGNNPHMPINAKTGELLIENDTYSAVLNVGIRDNGDSMLYDINQFNKI